MPSTAATQYVFGVFGRSFAAPAKKAAAATKKRKKAWSIKVS
jgi:hypothetical protein